MRTYLVTIAWVSLTNVPFIHAESPDWVQWGGPHHNFQCDGARLADTWPEDGPKTRWSRELGDGYSAIVTDGKALYTMYSVREKKEKNKYALEGKEVVVALDAKTGKTLWEYSYDVLWTAGMAMEFGPGPHSTPLLADHRLMTVGTTGKLHCFDTAGGKVLWQHALRDEYNVKTEEGDRGYGSSPLAYDGNVVLPVGGRGQGLVAFRIADGREAWKAGDFDMTYASVFPITFDGREQLIVFGPTEVIGMNPATGDTLWSLKHPTQYGANISTPVYGDDGRLFISSAYGQGSRGIELTKSTGKITAKEMWYNPKMKIHFGNAVRLGDVVYGSSGDFGPCLFCAVNIKTGEFLWQQRGIKKANVLAVGDKLLILDEDGRLILARASAKGYEELARAQVCNNNAWTVPTLVGKVLYVRDRKQIKAIELG